MAEIDPDPTAPAERDAGVGHVTTEVAPSSKPSARRTREGAAAPAPGDRIGRFTVLEVLGRGGMGIVISAYDPRLDRRVAIKLVSSPEAEHREHRDRLLREARAMAKLRHPNAVAVYEVGEHGGQVYVAMEEVDGGTLRDVLAERERRGEDDWRQVVERFVEAGRGLAAAHAQGMVHRDFKPDNVLVDASGRVLVGDFGLVSGARDRAAKDGDRDALADTDAVVGTPAYMAPEQHRGRDVDGRADQFAFCVALYEALYGELPFAGQTAGERARAVERGDVRPPRRDKKVPGWLRETLLRGLAAEPEARHPSMAALLSELGADPEGVWRVGRRMRVAMVAVFAAFTIAWVFSVIALGIEISYGILYATNAAFAGVMLAVAWIGRHAFARTAFNRKIIGSGLMVAALILALVAGGHLLAVAPVALGILHLFSFGVAFCIGAISIDSRLGRAGAVYVIAFLVASAWPSLYVPIHLAANAVGAFTFYIVVATSRSSER